MPTEELKVVERDTKKEVREKSITRVGQNVYIHRI
jgi:hypothetical protein